jgi:hypothetical protein
MAGIKVDLKTKGHKAGRKRNMPNGRKMFLKKECFSHHKCCLLL